MKTMNVATNLIIYGQIIHVSMFGTNIAPKKLNRVANMPRSVRWQIYCRDPQVIDLSLRQITVLSTGPLFASCLNYFMRHVISRRLCYITINSKVTEAFIRRIRGHTQN